MENQMTEIKCKQCSADSTKIVISVNADDQFIFKCTVCEDVILFGDSERHFYALAANILEENLEYVKSLAKKELLEQIGKKSP